MRGSVSKLQSSILSVNPGEYFNVFKQNSNIGKLIDMNKSSLVISVDISPQKQKVDVPVPKVTISQVNMKKKAEVPQIYFDEGELYQNDYSDIKEVQTVKKLLEKDKQSSILDDQYQSKRLNYFSCDVRFVKLDGKVLDLIALVTCCKFYLIGLTKFDKKDEIDLQNIRKILIG